MTFIELMENVARGFEAIGVGVLVVGLLWSMGVAASVWLRARSGRDAYRILREGFGGALLLGLEILVAADLIKTIAVAPTVQNVAVLGLIVLIRTFLSFSLEIEIEGVPPWRRAAASGAGLMGRAAVHAREARQTAPES
jgi:uncharacterized membrane protein